MNGYLISAQDQPGFAARLFGAAQKRGVNIFPAYGLSDGERALVLVGSNDEAGLEAAIEDAGLSATPLEMVVTRLSNTPGTGAELFSRLAAAGINLLAAVPVGMEGDSITVALAATDAAALKAAVG